MIALCRPFLPPDDADAWTADDIKAAIGTLLPKRGWALATCDSVSDACEWCGRPHEALGGLSHPDVDGLLIACAKCQPLLIGDEDASEEYERQRYNDKETARLSVYRTRAADLTKWRDTPSGGILIEVDRDHTIQIELSFEDRKWHWRLRIGKQIYGPKNGGTEDAEAAFAMAVSSWAEIASKRKNPLGRNLFDWKFIADDPGKPPPETYEEPPDPLA